MGFTSAWLTVFQITLAPAPRAYIGRLMIFEVSPLYVLFFVPYTMGVTFAIVRVISAIFLKETMAASSADQDMAIALKMKARDKQIKGLREIFLEGDEQGDGHINADEFHRMLHDERVK